MTDFPIPLTPAPQAIEGEEPYRALKRVERPGAVQPVQKSGPEPQGDPDSGEPQHELDLNA